MARLLAAAMIAGLFSTASPALAQGAPDPSGQTGPTPTESKARQALEKSGYSQIRNVKASPKGVTAKAVKDGKDVSVVVDPTGKVRKLQPGQ